MAVVEDSSADVLLRRLGLERFCNAFEAAFLTNWDVLCEVTHDDLLAIGMQDKNERDILLHAIHSHLQPTQRDDHEDETVSLEPRKTTAETITSETGLPDGQETYRSHGPSQPISLDLLCRSGVSGQTRRKGESRRTYAGRLTHLKLEERHIAKIEHFDILCRQLQVLYLYSNAVTKIQHLPETLTHLYLQNNRIRRMEGLDRLGMLRKLYLSENCIERVEGLQGCQSLEELYIQEQRISAPLSFCPKSIRTVAASLHTLDASSNHLDALEPLVQLQCLEHLLASGNQLASLPDVLSLFHSVPSLTHVDLSGNPVTSQHKYRDRVILAAAETDGGLEVLDGRRVTAHEREFLTRWRAVQKGETKHRLRQMMGEQRKVRTRTNLKLPPLSHAPTTTSSSLFSPSTPHTTFTRRTGFAATRRDETQGSAGVKARAVRRSAPEWPWKDGMLEIPFIDTST
ncbi:unnamed protein product [Vitrella brassicaformis CCMP3155]|uniref:SAM domain-containing protein n=2 Tax=Vitrella brassicaformis TaxID=1169539 RepID=A0A0G4GMA6_VITBC|nr:unnamed protein product [Vitrella brassicaformis CCMP3155]|eukprot:CEM31328.1 unnamed protein product [Vitrella brassicaformis CCMP3155]